MNEKYQIESSIHNKQVSESNIEAHTCLFCGTKFVNKNDLELHSHLHDKNKSFICSLCKEVFPELKLLKLHDLRHSLEEAHEEMSDIENLLTPLALSPCRVCSEMFPCDEELIEHYVTHHKTVENVTNGLVEVSNDDLSSDSCDSSGEEQINYPLLREEIVTKNGIMHIRFTLIDHPNVQVGEFNRIIEHKIKTKKRNLKSDNKSKKIMKVSEGKINNKKSNLKLSSTSKLSHKVLKLKDRKKIPEPGSISKKSHKAKISKLNSKSISIDRNLKRRRNIENEVLDVSSSDSDVEIVFENYEKDLTVNREKNTNVKRPRHSKLLALKKKIWKSNPNTALPTKVCHSCQKSFTSVDKYERHLLSHKKYNCRKCYQVFRSATLLHRHTILNHAQAKRNSYQCETCKKEFFSVIKWKDHKKTHTLKKELQCSKCGREFKNVRNVKNHSCKLSKIICKICKSEFLRMYNLKRHLTNVHKLEKAEVNRLVEVGLEENKKLAIPENNQEIKKSKQDTELLLDEAKEKNDRESSTKTKNSLLNGKINENKRVSQPSNLSSVSSKKENKSVSSLVKRELPTKNINPIKVLPSQLGKKQSLSNKKETTSNKKNNIPENKVNETTNKTGSKKTTKNTSSSKRIPTKLTIPKKPVKKTKASVPYLSKGNSKRAVRKLVTSKNKKKTVINSKKSSSRTKNLSPTSKKSKLRPKRSR